MNYLDLGMKIKFVHLKYTNACSHETDKIHVSRH